MNVLQSFYRVGGRVRVEQISEPDREGFISVQLMFDTEAEACGCVLSFGAGVEIVEPIELRQRVIDLAQSVLRSYAGAGSIPTDETTGDSWEIVRRTQPDRWLHGKHNRPSRADTSR